MRAGAEARVRAGAGGGGRGDHGEVDQGEKMILKMCIL